MFRKKIHNFLYKLSPDNLIPLYSMVSFSNIPYSEVISRSAAQDKLVTNLLIGAGSTILIGAAAFAINRWKLKLDFTFKITSSR